MKSQKSNEKMRQEYPAKDSPVALTLENEIIRIALEKGLEIGVVTARLSNAVGVSERHIYDYRNGKTDIPSMLIPKFCREFGSNALAMSVVTLCNETEFDERDAFDLGRFASQSIRNVLQSGDDFLEAFDDGVIDGFELSKLSRSTARIIRDANRLLEVAQVEYQRRRCAA